MSKSSIIMNIFNFIKKEVNKCNEMLNSDIAHNCYKNEFKGIEGQKEAYINVLEYMLKIMKGDKK